MGSTMGYEGFAGDFDRGMVDTFGRGGSTLLMGNLNYLWMQSNPYAQERDMTGKLFFSFRTPRFFAGRVNMGYSPKRVLYQSIFTAAWGIFLCLVMIFLILNNSLGNATPFLLLVFSFMIGWTIFAFLLMRSLIKASVILERQPIPKR